MSETSSRNDAIQEEVYMQQPKDFMRKGEEHLVRKLKKLIKSMVKSMSQDSGSEVCSGDNVF